jgi:signal transduction histidine kinase
LFFFGGSRYFPAAFLGSFLGECVDALLPLSWGASEIVSLREALRHLEKQPVGHIIESTDVAIAALLVAKILVKFSFSTHFEKLKDTVLLLSASAFSEIILSLIQVPFNMSMNGPVYVPFNRVAISYFIGDTIGIFLIFPLCCFISNADWKALRKPLRLVHLSIRGLRLQVLECLIGMAVTALLLHFVIEPVNGNYASWYLTLLPVAWAALRYEQAGASLINIAMSVSIVTLIRLHEIDIPLFQLQLLMFTLCVMGLLLATLAMERRTAAQELARFHREEAQRARREAEQALKAKAEFLATTSHDLRQPLQSMHLSLSVLEAQPLSDIARKSTERIKAAADGLTRLFDNLLDAARVEGEFETADIRPVSLTGLFEDLDKEFSALAEERHIRLRVVPTQLWVLSDAILLERALRNVLSNAVRFTPTGGKVVFGCRRFDRFVHILIDNSGSSIAEDKIKLIFEPFVTLEPATRRDGVGLGLSLVKQISDRLGLGIMAIPSSGKGMRFRFTLPLSSRSFSLPHRSPEASRFPIALKDRVVGVLEDDHIVRQLLTELFEHSDAAVIAASNLAQLQTKLTETGSIPDVIVADYQLASGPDGVTTALEIMRLTGQAIPTLILSATPTPMSLKTFRVLRKPASAAEILEALSLILPA